MAIGLRIQICGMILCDLTIVGDSEREPDRRNDSLSDGRYGLNFLHCHDHDHPDLNRDLNSMSQRPDLYLGLDTMQPVDLSGTSIISHYKYYLSTPCAHATNL
jgi:hypothetical protein